MKLAGVPLTQDDFNFCEAFLHLCACIFLKDILTNKIVKMQRQLYTF